MSHQWMERVRWRMVVLDAVVGRQWYEWRNRPSPFSIIVVAPQDAYLMDVVGVW